MTPAIRWAIFGTGSIARRFAADMRFSRNGAVAAVGSRDEARARAFAGWIGGDVAAGRMEDIASLSGVDAVYVATPNALHDEHALLALAHGKPVLVEKPLASSPAAARRIIEAAGKAKLLAMEAMWMRFTPGMTRLRRLVAEGDPGRIVRIEAGLSYAAPFDPADPRHDPEHGGALLDLGVYPVSLALDLLGPPTHIRASGIRSPNGAIAEAGLVLTHESGALSVLSCGFAAEGANEARIVGTRGVLSVHRPLLCPPMISLRRSAPGVSPSADPAGRLPSRPRLPFLQALRPLAAPLKERRRLLFQRGSGLHHQADHFAECLSHGIAESPVMPLSHSIAALEILDEASVQIRGEG